VKPIWMLCETAIRLGLDSRFWEKDQAYSTPPGCVFLRNSERLYGLWFITLNAMLSGGKIESDYRQAFNDTETGPPKTFQGKAPIDSFETGSEATLVMLVAALEAYLRDVLAFAARRDPSIMKQYSVGISANTDQLMTYQSIDEFRDTLPLEWARVWLDRRKSPKDWIGGLRKLGVDGIAEDAASRLNLVRGIRHVIVHSAGIVDRDFVRQHPEAGRSIGDKIHVGDEGIRSAANSVFDLFAPTEEHFAKAFVRKAV